MLDNYATHKTPRVKRWLQQHPQYHMHFMPTRRGHLSASIDCFVLQRRRRPFTWSADGDLLLGRVERHCQRISKTGHYRGPDQEIAKMVRSRLGGVLKHYRRAA